MQGDAIKDAKGLPPNIRPPRNRWQVQHVTLLRPMPWWSVRIYVFRQRYGDIAPHFSGGAFVHQWWSWHVALVIGKHGWHVWRWRERWAV